MTTKTMCTAMWAGLRCEHIHPHAGRHARGAVTWVVESHVDDEPCPSVVLETGRSVLCELHARAPRCPPGRGADLERAGVSTTEARVLTCGSSHTCTTCHHTASPAGS